MSVRTADPGTAVVPYYKSDLVELYLGDCRDVAASLPSGSVDLLIADPPYGVAWQSRFRKEPFAVMDGDAGGSDWPAALGAITRRLLKNHRHAYVFGYTAEDLAGPMQLGGCCELIWDKSHLGMGNLNLPWGPEHEPILFGVRENSSVNRAAGRGALAARMRKGSVLTVRRPNSGQVRHPDEKPVPLLREFVESSSVPGDVVFDPTCGTGSTIVAAVLAGRKAIGVETSREFVDISLARVKAAENLAKLAAAI